MYQQINKGAANPTVRVKVVDNPAGTPETSVSASGTGITLWYERERAGRTTFTAFNLTNASASWTAGGFIHISDGYCRMDLPDAAVTTGANTVLCGVSGLTSMVGIATLVDLTEPLSISAFGVKVTAFSSDAFDASAVAASAVSKIQAGLALATSLSAVETRVIGVAASLSAVQANVAAMAPKVASLSFVSGNVLSRMITAAADSIDNSVIAATAVTKIQAGVALAISLSAVETRVIKIAASLSAVQANVGAMAPKIASLSFQAGHVLSDLRGINGVTINGDGSGTPFGP